MDDKHKPNNAQSSIAPYIGGLISGGAGGTIGKPFAQEIFLIASHVAGTSYVDNIEEASLKLGKGSRLYFFREPDNLTDPMAIVIRNKDGQKLGYVPRKNNEIISRLMDAGKMIYGVAEEVEEVGDWMKITMQIMLND